MPRLLALALPLLLAAAPPTTTTITVPVTGDIKDIRFHDLAGIRYMAVHYTAPETVTPAEIATHRTPFFGRDYTELFRRDGDTWRSLATDYALAAPVSDPAQFGAVAGGRAQPTTALLYTDLFPVVLAGPPDHVAFVYGFIYFGGPDDIQHGELTVAVETLTSTGLMVSWHDNIPVRGGIEAVSVEEDGSLFILTPASGPDDPACCSTKYLHLWLRWDGAKFVEKRRCLADDRNGSC